MFSLVHKRYFVNPYLANSGTESVKVFIMYISWLKFENWGFYRATFGINLALSLGGDNIFFINKGCTI